jgi:hypothetical protein
MKKETTAKHKQNTKQGSLYSKILTTKTTTTTIVIIITIRTLA